MFYYIKGELVLTAENYAVIEAGGIGYKVYTSLNTLAILPGVGTNVTLYTHLYVREDICDLYGFGTNEELSMFLHLISVSGVGPKAALSILSVATPEKFALAVITNDKKTITKAQGVGPKLAERVILELRDKIKSIDALPNEIKDAEITESSQSEAVSALTVLGYSLSEATAAVSQVSADLGLEEIIKEALKKLMK